VTWGRTVLLYSVPRLVERESLRWPVRRVLTLSLCRESDKDIERCSLLGVYFAHIFVFCAVFSLNNKISRAVKNCWKIVRKMSLGETRIPPR
jgi:hypothetical protein